MIEPWWKEKKRRVSSFRRAHPFWRWWAMPFHSGMDAKQQAGETHANTSLERTVYMGVSKFISWWHLWNLDAVWWVQPENCHKNSCCRRWSQRQNGCCVLSSVTRWRPFDLVAAAAKECFLKSVWSIKSKALSRPAKCLKNTWWVLWHPQPLCWESLVYAAMIPFCSQTGSLFGGWGYPYHIVLLVSMFWVSSLTLVTLWSFKKKYN